LKIILLGIIVALTVLLYQNMVSADDFAQPPANPNMIGGLRVNGNIDVVGCTRYYNATVIRSFICAGTMAIGDEIVQGRPEDLYYGFYRTRLSMSGHGAIMMAQFNDICWDCTADKAPYKVGILLVDGEARPTPLLRGVVGQTGPNQDNWVFDLWQDHLCFAPPDGGRNPSVFDTCMARVETNGEPDWKFTAGNKYVYLSELSTLLGR
jgi:hypothetical protein